MGQCKPPQIYFRTPQYNVLFHFQGQTGFPWIDAIMTQLREEGWIHHLARHAVACFLTRGDLWISWEDGTSSNLVMLMIYRYPNEFFSFFNFFINWPGC
jgi:deoxyribodipyrimidine photolyase